MNKREIILDFTSLLDVIMIILFFFILFSHIETINAIEEKEKMQAEHSQIIEEAEQIKSNAEELLAEAEIKNSQAEKLLAEVMQSDSRTAYNIEGIDEFSKGLNLRINLNMNGGSGDWELDVFCGDDFLDSIQKSTPETMKQSFAHIVEEKGYTSEDTVLCVFTFNAGESGTRSAYKATEEMFELFTTEYQHFFCSEADISIEKE